MKAKRKNRTRRAQTALGQKPKRFLFDALERRQMMAAHVAGSSASYSTIQAAVNAAPVGGTVTVDAGTYTETVTIGKSLTIQGIQATIDARSNVRRESGIESIVTGANTSAGIGASFVVQANDVTIDGFTVQGETSQDLAVGAGIVVAPRMSGTHVLNNIVQNNVSGLFLANYSSTDAAVLQHNIFRNNNNAGANGGRAVYTDQSISGGNLTNVTIDGNEFFNNRGSSRTTGLESALAFEAGVANAQSNITITNNAFDGNGKAVLFFNTTGVLIQGNTVTYTLDWYSGTLRFEGNNHDVTITQNLLFNNTGPAVAIDTKGVPGDNSGFVVTYNNIYGNDTHSGKHYGLVFNGDVYDGPFDARYNYWGSASGPSGDGPGTGDSVYGSGHVVSGSYWSTTAGQGAETFSPWATTPNGSLDRPYWGVASTDAAKIQAEDFNLGGQANAYNDADTINSGAKYRSNVGVDIETTTDTGGGYDVGWTKANEWLDYAINLAQGGTYKMDFRLACASTGATFHVLVDGVNVTGTLSAPFTGGSQAWQTVSVSGISLTSGTHSLRVMWDTNAANGSGPNFNWFQLTNTSPVVAPAAPTNLASAVSGSSTVNLSWTNNATNSTGVKIDRSIDGATWATVATAAAAATTYTDTGLSAVTTYYYRVRATNAGGDSTNSNIASATTQPSSTAPTYLSDLNWTSATTGYGAVQNDATIKGNTIKLRGTSYARGIGAHAVSQIVYTLNGQYGTFISDAGVDDETSGQGAIDFQVIGDGVVLYDSGVLTGASAVAHISVNIAGVQQLTLVAGSGVAGSIDYDHADWAGARLLVAAPAPAVPAAPSGLTSTAGSSTSVFLSWTNNATNQTGFTIYRATGSGAATSLATVAGNVTSYTDTSAAASTTYTFTVVATNSTGASPVSNTASATTPSASATSTNLSTLNWTSATTGYGSIQLNASVRGNALMLRGTTYASGIGAHASSTITYALNGGYTTFLSDVGVDDEVNGQGAIDFQVIGDGVVLFDSGVLTGGSPVAHINVSVAGVQTLQIVASPGVAGTIDYDHADWAGARLLSGGATPMMMTNAATAFSAAAVTDASTLKKKLRPPLTIVTHA